MLGDAFQIDHSMINIAHFAATLALVDGRHPRAACAGTPVSRCRPVEFVVDWHTAVATTTAATTTTANFTTTTVFPQRFQCICSWHTLLLPFVVIRIRWSRRQRIVTKHTICSHFPRCKHSVQTRSSRHPASDVTALLGKHGCGRHAER